MHSIAQENSCEYFRLRSTTFCGGTTMAEIGCGRWALGLVWVDGPRLTLLSVCNVHPSLGIASHCRPWSGVYMSTSTPTSPWGPKSSTPSERVLQHCARSAACDGLSLSKPCWHWSEHWSSPSWISVTRSLSVPLYTSHHITRRKRKQASKASVSEK